MAGRSRRNVLAAATGGLAALAGCSFTTEGTYDGEALRRLAEKGQFERPDHHPLAVPGGMVRNHRARARAILGEVPASPEVPNELIASDITNERERLHEALRQTTETTPEGGNDTGGETAGRKRAFDRLGVARRHREDAAALLGTYRAATDDIGRTDLERRRDEQRDRLAAFRSAWDYRASDPVRAALVHEHLEHLLGSVEHALTPWPRFPDDPAGDMDDVGYLVEKVEEAAALLDDLERYREQITGEGTQVYRPALMAAATWLRRRARRESFGIEEPLERGLEAFDRDLGTSVARYRFTMARDAVQDYSNSDLLDAIEEEGYANGVLFATTRRAAVTTLADTVETIESGPPGTDVSAGSIETTRRRAHETVGSKLDYGPDGLMARVLDPAFTTMQEARDELQSGTSGTPPRAYAGYLYADRFAVAAVDAADELAFLLDEGAG